MIADKPIDRITSDDIEDLVSNGVPESRALEYKEYLPAGSDQDKREFLYDVSSFANATGGDLIYGAREKRDEAGKATGTAEAIVGVEISNLDQAIQRLENILRDGMSPRIPGIRFLSIGAFERGPTLLVRVPRSWAAPHMVTFQQSGKFFTRHAGGKHPLDVSELRDAFLNSRSASERAEEFRTARVGRIIGGGAPVALSSGRLLFFHAIPHGSAFGAFSVDLHKVNTTDDLQPIDARSWSPRFNLDGLLVVPGAEKGTKPNGYTQLFRNGIVEAVYSEVFFDPSTSRIEPGVSGPEIAKQLVAFLNRLAKLYLALEVSAPISIFVSLHGMKDVVFHGGQRTSYARYAFDRDSILLPELVLNSFDGDLQTMLNPLFQMLWQAAGAEGWAK
jgi:hypothetical protein